MLVRSLKVKVSLPGEFFAVRSSELIVWPTQDGKVCCARVEPDVEGVTIFLVSLRILRT